MIRFGLWLGLTLWRDRAVWQGIEVYLDKPLETL
jgi:hypothetical protein